MESNNTPCTESTRTDEDRALFHTTPMEAVSAYTCTSAPMSVNTASVENAITSVTQLQQPKQKLKRNRAILYDLSNLGLFASLIRSSPGAANVRFRFRI